MLTDEQIKSLWEGYNPMHGIQSFARAIEAEVRKADDALIRQMLEALELAQCQHAVVWTTPSVEIDGAITAARARLGDKT